MEIHENIDQNEEFYETNLDDDLLNSVLDKLEDMLERAGISIKQLSAMTGIPEGTIRKFFGGGKKNPSLRNTIKVVQALGGSLDELVGIERPCPKHEPVMIPVYLRLIANADAARVSAEAARDKAEASLNRVTTCLFVVLALLGLCIVSMFFLLHH